LHYPGIGKKSVADLALICYSRKSYIFCSRQAEGNFAAASSGFAIDA